MDPHLTGPEHPVTPPEDVIEALRSQAPQCDVDAGVNKVRETQLVIAAYRAGADHELEEILLYPGEEPEDCRYFDNVPAANIRAWRRPKPPSLAELALRELEQTIVLLMPVTGSEKIKRFNTIRAALERLQELENNG
jgi:hypothetical protein